MMLDFVPRRLTLPALGNIIKVSPSPKSLNQKWVIYMLDLEKIENIKLRKKLEKSVIFIVLYGDVFFPVLCSDNFKKS